MRAGCMIRQAGIDNYKKKENKINKKKERKN